MPLITNRVGALEYLTAANICVPHCFTTRLGGVSKGHLDSLNIGMHRGDEPENVRRNYAVLGEAIGFVPEQLVLAHQIHSDIVRAVSLDDAMGLDHHRYPQCDALITNTPGTGLVVFTADCTPILLHDPVTGAVGAIHAGWRGTAAQIGAKTVRAMEKHYGCKPENIRAAIGPNIAQCCFQTDADVPQAMIESLGEGALACIQARGDKYYVNLKEINARILRQAGVTRVEIAKECTACEPARFWSHRVTGGVRGSQGAIILCREGRQ